jgi:regulator of RNase E activity RraA
MFGPAATIAFMPYRDDMAQADLGFGELFYEALGPQPMGQVLVLSSGGYPDASHGGGTKLGRVEHHRLAGVLADGRLRDFEQLRSYNFATWCRGEATRWGGDTVMPYAANTAVEFDGVTVTPGDLVYADAAGAVVIPADSLTRVLDEADAVEREDAEAAAQIQHER